MSSITTKQQLKKVINKGIEVPICKFVLSNLDFNPSAIFLISVSKNQIFFGKEKALSHLLKEPILNNLDRNITLFNNLYRG